MTKEEKKTEAQIKEYAANLPSAIDIDQLTVEERKLLQASNIGIGLLSLLFC